MNNEELKPGALCGCRRCLDGSKAEINGIPATSAMMVLCTVCGNKRCPHANDHRNVCTNSNDPGQPGSAYPRWPEVHGNAPITTSAVQPASAPVANIEDVKDMAQARRLITQWRGRAEAAEAALACSTVESLALNAITYHFNEFISECMAVDGNPQAPSKRALAHARACMPKPQSTAFNATPSTPEIENAATVGQWKDRHA